MTTALSMWLRPAQVEIGFGFADDSRPDSTTSHSGQVTGKPKVSCSGVKLTRNAHPVDVLEAFIEHRYFPPNLRLF